MFKDNKLREVVELLIDKYNEFRRAVVKAVERIDQKVGSLEQKIDSLETDNHETDNQLLKKQISFFQSRQDKLANKLGLEYRDGEWWKKNTLYTILGERPDNVVMDYYTERYCNKKNVTCHCGFVAKTKGGLKSHYRQKHNK